MGNLRATSDINRTIQDLVNEVNRLNKIIKEGSIGKPKPYQNVRVVDDGEGNYQVEFKHKDGWIKSDTTSATGYKLKEK